MGLIPIRGNGLGLAMIVLSAIVAGIGSAVLKLGDAAVMIGVGGALIAMDVLLRSRSRPQAGWLTQRQYGGFLYFIPIWGVGLVVIAANVFKTLAG